MQVLTVFSTPHMFVSTSFRVTTMYLKQVCKASTTALYVFSKYYPLQSPQLTLRTSLESFAMSTQYFHGKIISSSRCAVHCTDIRCHR